MSAEYEKLVRRIEAIEQGKSYYAPVAGEPSLGTAQYQPKTSSVWKYTNTAPAAATWYTITFTGFPAGTTALWVFGAIYAETGAYDYLRWRPYNNGDSWANSMHRTVACTFIGTQFSGTPTLVIIDSSGRVDFAVGTTNSDIYITDWVYREI